MAFGFSDARGKRDDRLGSFNVPQESVVDLFVYTSVTFSHTLLECTHPSATVEVKVAKNMNRAEDRVFK